MKKKYLIRLRCPHVTVTTILSIIMTNHILSVLFAIEKT